MVSYGFLSPDGPGPPSFRLFRSEEFFDHLLRSHCDHNGLASGRPVAFVSQVAFCPSLDIEAGVSKAATGT